VCARAVDDVFLRFGSPRERFDLLQADKTLQLLEGTRGETCQVVAAGGEHGGGGAEEASLRHRQS
jgi:hypothetical protein